MQILVISLAGIGDTLFATPLIEELRANFPRARIDALVMWRGAKEVLEANPYLNNLYHKNLIDASRWEGLRYLWSLRSNKYDFSFNTHPQSKLEYRGVARLIGARTRISHRYHSSPLLDRLLVNRSISQNYHKHSVENNLALLSLAGAELKSAKHRYELFLGAAEKDFARNFLSEHKLAGRTLLGIHVGSGGTKNLALRRWPLANYGVLIKSLVATFPQLGVLLFGGPGEAEGNAQLLGEVNKPNLFCPQTKSFRDAVALVAHCEGFLSVDTALMHVAAATKVPKQFVIETPTWNKCIEPYREDFILIPNPRVAQRNLDYYRYDGRGIQESDEEITRCMESVSVESVFQTVAEGLSHKTDKSMR